MHNKCKCIAIILSATSIETSFLCSFQLSLLCDQFSMLLCIDGQNKFKYVSKYVSKYKKKGKESKTQCDFQFFSYTMVACLVPIKS